MGNSRLLLGLFPWESRGNGNGHSVAREWELEMGGNGRPNQKHIPVDLFSYGQLTKPQTVQ